jgi:hypothetical protein
LLVRLLRGFSLFVAPRELIRASKSSEAWVLAKKTKPSPAFK